MAEESMDLSTLFANLNPTFWKIGRLQTFEHWPFKSNEHQCNPDNMATAGFYAIGGKEEPDLAECFFCKKQLDGWEPIDDPWQEHKRHQPNCLFIKINKQDEGSLTIKELFQLIGNYHKNKIRYEFEKCVEELKDYWKESASNIPDLCEAMKKSQRNG